ncbi:MAG: ASKHA domain-containing protein [Defluviitaleaceae bacterium]|nr:ASKHA domain-containing protein [Defluviitaleaceae bacterium]MCL2263574.1 ASKHA domain-containing protein [Defluviitaleaceae bacterium]
MKNCGKCGRKGNCADCITGEISTAENYETGGAFCETLRQKERGVNSDVSQNCYGIAIDIGTTTVVMELLNLQTGERVAVSSCANSQREMGLDVISRVTQANAGGSARLRELIMHDIEQGICKLLSNSGTDKTKISRVVICGNTTMLHLLQGFSCETLGVFPFTPVSVELVRAELFGFDTIIMQGVSAFIGADIVAGIFYCDKTLGVSPPRSYHLFLDLGTNGEIVLFDGKNFFATSVAAGPAFEGGNISAGCASVSGAIAKVHFSAEENVFSCETIHGKPPVGICGTGVISVCAELLRHGLADETGLLKTGDVTISSDEKEILFTQKDIREVQLAKAAVRAGIEILIAEAGISYENIEKVFLAGGFGYTMDAEDAAVLGLIPSALKEKIFSVGNAALGGAAKFLLNPDYAAEIQKIASSVKEINLANHPKFEELFITHCNF